MSDIGTHLVRVRGRVRGRGRGRVGVGYERTSSPP